MSYHDPRGGGGGGMKFAHTHSLFIHTFSFIQMCITVGATAPECSRLANQPSLYGILSDRNVGANVELARILRSVRNMASTTCSVRSLPSSSRPARVTLMNVFVRRHTHTDIRTHNLFEQILMNGENFLKFAVF